MAILIDKINFKTTKTIVIRYKEGYFTMMKVSIHLEDIAVINICVPKTVPQVHETQTDGSVMRNRQFTSNNWRL